MLRKVLMTGIVAAFAAPLFVMPAESRDRPRSPIKYHIVVERDGTCRIRMSRRPIVLDTFESRSAAERAMAIKSQCAKKPYG